MNFVGRLKLAGAAMALMLTAAHAETTYNIASMADFTGPYADTMKDMAGGRVATVAWWNEEVGKSLGIRLILKEYDHRYDPAQVASLWPGIKAELNPIAILGVGAPEAAALQQRLPSDGITLILSTAGLGLSWKSDPWVFHPRPTYAHEAAAFFEWYRKEKGIEEPLKVAVITSEASPAYVDIGKGIEHYAKESPDEAQVVETIFTEIQPTDLTTQIKRVLGKGAQLLDVQTNTAAVVATKRALQALGRTDVPIVMSSHNGLTVSEKAIGDLSQLEGDYEVYGMAMPTNDPTEAHNFYTVLKEKYGMAGNWTVPSLMGINQALVAVRAIEAAAKTVQADKVTGTAVREALLSTPISSSQTFGILSDLHYTNEAPFPTKGATVNIGTVKDGRYTIAVQAVAVPEISKW